MLPIRDGTVAHPGSEDRIDRLDESLPWLARGVAAGIEADVQAQIETAVKFAMDAPYPSTDEVDQDIYA